MVQYSTPSGKTTYWFCRNCYEDKLAREKFQNKICEIFGIKAPGPLIWTQRKRLIDEYGYTDDAIIDCLEYIYNVEHMKILKESLGLVNPTNMNKMKSWRAHKQAQAGSIVAAISQMETKEYVVPVRERKVIHQEINLDDALLE